jgi:gamma-glutamylcyclotransferase (GGCT)/AIG2-like uncharacterized protein YtfP
MIEPLPIFVYGTLKRGQCRQRCWPRQPVRVEWAVVRGRLYDLGPYPAMVTGDDLIRGELWHLRPEDVPETLERLDEIEGCVEGTGDQYVRVIIECRDDQDGSHRAYAYQFARRDTIERYPVVTAAANGFCEWFPAKEDADQDGSGPSRSSLAQWADENAENWGAALDATDVEGFTGRNL